MSNTFKVIDLFCGMGGFSYGMELAGLETILGVDINDDVRYAFENNHSGEFLNQDINLVDPTYIQSKFLPGDIRVIVASPPCQDFSSMNTRKKEFDSRNNLVDSLRDLVSKLEFDYLLVENVIGIKKYPGYLAMKTDLEDRGYYVQDRVVNCSNYGVPQIRKRNLLLVSRFGLLEIPKKTSELRTVRDYIGDLPPLENGECSSISPLHCATRHSEIVIERIKATRQFGSVEKIPFHLQPNRIQRGESSQRQSCSILDYDSLAGTIISHLSIDAIKSIHPEQNRTLTPFEALLLQTFPKSYTVVGDVKLSKDKITRMIGNAVPPLLSKMLGESILTNYAIYNPSKSSPIPLPLR